MRSQCVLRSQVDVAPGRVKGADFQHHQVEGSESGARLRVLVREARVAAEKNLVTFAGDHPGRPQSLVAVAEAASGKVLRGRCGEREIRARDAMKFPPIQ